MAERNHLFLVDGSGYIFRAYYALPPLYRKSDGLPTGAVNGFCNMLYKLIEDTHKKISPTHLAVIFDSARKTFRNDIYKEYKANRGDPPEDLIPQFKIIKDAVKAFGIPSIELSGYEADDIIATYASLAENKKWSVSIVSSDKDLMQIVSNQVKLIDTMKNKTIGPNEVLEKFGVGPKNVIDVQALAGDSSDNVPGAPGIGIKTAAQLINEFQSIENLLQNYEEIKQQKRRETIRDSRENILISKELVTLKRDVNNIPALDDLVKKEISVKTLVPFLDELELKKLSERIRKKNPNIKITSKKLTSTKKLKNLNEQIEKPDDNFKKSVKISNSKTSYNLINDEKKLKKLVSEIYDAGEFVYDVETDSLNIIEANLVGVSFCFNQKIAYYIPVQHVDHDEKKIQSQISLKSFLSIIAPLMKDESIIKIGHNIKYDNSILNKYGVEVRGFHDTMLMSYVLDAGVNRHNMDELANIHLNRETIKFKDIVGSGKSQITFDKVKIDDALNYAAEDAEITYKLYLFLKKRVQQEKGNYIYTNIERELINPIQSMETNGIKVDKKYLNDLSFQFSQRIEKLEKKIYKETGSKFNIGSPKQLSEILFEKLKLKPPKKTKTGEKSTGIEVLEDLAYEGNKVADTIIQWRQISKLKNTYTDALQNHIIKKTGRIHTSFAMASTNTGRLASSDPNLQNIPIRTEEGKSIRKAFIPDQGYVMFAADYSQIELRVLAHMADVVQLKEAFINNEDIHQITASEIFNVKLKEVDNELRRKAKAVNFGIIYGISAYGLAKQLSISNYEAGDFIKKYFQKFSGIKEFMDYTKEFCRNNGYVETICGRKCFFPRIKDKNFALRSFQERAAINAPIQGTAADIIKLAMIKINGKIKNSNDCKMLLQVHDELIFEIKKSKLDRFKKIIIEEMENALMPKFDFSVPLVVDHNHALNWSDAH